MKPTAHFYIRENQDDGHNKDVEPSTGCGNTTTSASTRGTFSRRRTADSSLSSRSLRLSVRSWLSGVSVGERIQARVSADRGLLRVSRRALSVVAL